VQRGSADEGLASTPQKFPLGLLLRTNRTREFSCVHLTCDFLVLKRAKQTGLRLVLYANMSLSTFRELNSDGKLHKRLVFQLLLLTTISLILLGVVMYQVLFGGLNISIAVSIALVSFLLGLFLFSKMNKVVWNEEEELVKTGRMEILGVAVLVLYIGFEVGLRTLLAAEFTGGFAATAYLLAGVGASLLGRSVGTIVSIQKLTEDETNPL